MSRIREMEAKINELLKHFSDGEIFAEMHHHSQQSDSEDLLFRPVPLMEISVKGRPELVEMFNLVTDFPLIGEPDQVWHETKETVKKVIQHFFTVL